MISFDSKVSVRRRIELLFLSKEIRPTCLALSKVRLDHPESDFLKLAAFVMVKNNPRRITAARRDYDPRALAVFVLIDAILDLSKALRTKREGDKMVQGLLEIDGLNLVKLAHGCVRYLHAESLVSLEDFRKLSAGIQSEA